MTKKIISSLLALLTVILLFGGCAKKTEVKINGTNIDNEVTAYFKATAQEGEDVNALIARYVAINSEFNNRSLTVPANMRSSLSDDVNSIWNLFGTYYEGLGISKETIYKIELSKVYETLLLEERYGENGVSPVSEDDLKEYFRGNYASIRFVTGYMFEVTENGTTEMTEKQKDELKQSFNAAADAVNDGTSIEEAVGLLNSAEIHDTVVNSKGNDNFPDGFWDEVKKIEVNKAAVINLGSYIFLVQKVDSEKGDYECYSEYKSDCLYQMKGEEFDKIIDAWTKQYK
ncbi:MAG: peptidyl-prolyl cis-trans isomerase [Oscillospiraceae bacterium]|nr:peptidyl-prolyl cis-trans isomerase [Oscillospiraceae bacterium]